MAHIPFRFEKDESEFWNREFARTFLSSPPPPFTVSFSPSVSIHGRSLYIFFCSSTRTIVLLEALSKSRSVRHSPYFLRHFPSSRFRHTPPHPPSFPLVLFLVLRFLVRRLFSSFSEDFTRAYVHLAESGPSRPPPPPPPFPALLLSEFDPRCFFCNMRANLCELLRSVA